MRLARVVHFPIKSCKEIQQACQALQKGSRRVRTPFVLAVIAAVACLIAPMFALAAVCNGPNAVCVCGATVTAVPSVTTTLGSDIIGCGPLGLDIDNGATLNCNGHTIAGTGSGSSSGILLNFNKNVTIKDCHVRSFANNFDLESSTFNTLTDNTSIGNTSSAGFFLMSSNKNTLRNNSAVKGVGISRGFFLGSSSHNTFTNNDAVGNAFRGFDIQFSSNYNNFTNSRAIDNGSAGFVLANGVSHNTISASEAISNASEGFIVFSDSSLNTFGNNEASGNGSPDCVDQSSGGGTSGTANTWNSNISQTSVPAGLCVPF
jgi:parallel beta-helix repeat protein